jgi:hypothetical protein
MEMNMRISLLPALAPVILAACTPAATPPEAGACNASGWMWLVGQPVDVVSACTSRTHARDRAG